MKEEYSYKGECKPIWDSRRQQMHCCFHSKFTIHLSHLIRIISFVSALAFSIPYSTHAQDPHFSQFYEAPLLLNPARAGFIKGTFELTGIYRSQWKDITLPFKTISGTANFNLPAGKNRNHIIGIAITDFADKSGDAAYTTNHIDAAFAFHKNFGKNFNHYLGGGLMFGPASTSFDASKLTFDENFMGGTNTEVLVDSKASYFDLSVGTEYNFLSDDQQFNAGIAIYHLTQPTVSYSNNSISVIYSV